METSTTPGVAANITCTFGTHNGRPGESVFAKKPDDDDDDFMDRGGGKKLGKEGHVEESMRKGRSVIT